MPELEPYTVDKSAWGDGPWQREPDRVDWIRDGLACFARRHPEHGHWCGYIGVPREHPYYGRKYEDVDDVPFHGGLTYSAPCKGDICHTPAPGMPDDVWWLGGDFAHFPDLSPGFAARMKVIAETIPAIAERESARAAFMRDVYRELEYVRAVVDEAADYLAGVEGWHK